MRVLQVCYRVPYPPHDGGAIGVYEIIRGVSGLGHHVTVLAVNTPKHYQPATALDHLGPNVRLLTVDVNTNLSPVRALRNLLFRPGMPYNVERFISPEFAARLKELVRTDQFDVVHFDGAFVAWYAHWLAAEGDGSGELPAWQTQLPRVLRAHNVEHIIWRRLSEQERNPLKGWYFGHLAGRMRDFEKWMLPGFDAVAAITDDDEARLQALAEEASGRLTVIPAPANTSRFRPDPARRPRPRTVFMLGSLNWLPNREGVDWFLREVWPQAHGELPELELHIAGVEPPPHLSSRPPGQEQVFVHGFVESAPDFMQTYELMLVPLLSGGGMRVKIVEGMALGKAIVSTSVGAEGIVSREGEQQLLLLRDGAAAWLATLRDYYHGRLPLSNIGQAAAQAAQGRYSTEAVARQFVSLYEQTIRAKQVVA